MKKDLFKYLAGNEYPGRGICLGISPDGSKAMIAYWIMGRSVNSRNRVFDAIPGGIRTVAADPAKLADPHLVIYNPVRTIGDTTIVTNGDQTQFHTPYFRRSGYAQRRLQAGYPEKLRRKCRQRTAPDL